jgi:agmatine deiminase
LRAEGRYDWDSSKRSVDPHVKAHAEVRDVDHSGVGGQVIARLEEQTDARIVKVPAPKLLKDELGFVDYSYINHYILNDAVLLCAFDDPNDQVAKGILEDVYPGREIRLIDARPIFDRGGGIHCITQQQPAV